MKLEPTAKAAAKPLRGSERRTSVRRWLRLAGQIVLAALALFGGYTAWLTIQPSIDIEVSQRPDGDAPLDPEFRITNRGPTSARNVDLNCIEIARFIPISDKPFPRDWAKGPLPDGPLTDPTLVLAPGRSVLKRCPLHPAPDGHVRIWGSHIAAAVDYRGELATGRGRRAIWFESFFDEDARQIRWRSVGDALSDADAADGRRRGQKGVTFKAGSDTPDIW
jgi:hypothetical protein